MNHKIISKLLIVTILSLILLINVPIVSADTPVPTITIDITSTPSPLSCSTETDIYSTYKEVLDNTQSTIDNVRATTNSVLWLVGAAFTLLTVEGFGSLWLTQKTSQQVSESAKNIASTERKALDVAETMVELNREVESLNKVHKKLKSKTRKLQKELEKIQDLEKDIEWYKKLMFLDDMQNQVIRFSKEDEWKDATNYIGVLLDQADSVTQLEIIRSIKNWIMIESEINEELAIRLNNILSSFTEHDYDRLLVLEATYTLALLNTKDQKK